MFVSQDNHKTTFDIEISLNLIMILNMYILSFLQTKLLIVSINVDIVVLSNQHVNSIIKA